MKIRRLPVNDAENGWSRILPPRLPRPALETDLKADWLVVGGGFAGLAAARRLAENRPGDRIVLLDAHECGENASGRNSGFAIDLPHTTSSSLDELDNAHKYMRLARAGIASLKQQVDTHGIRCDWARDGKFHAAVTAEGARSMLEPFATALQALGEPWRWVEADELRDRLGTAHFDRAVFTPGCVLLNPAALVRGLADTLPEQVTLCENTPVVAIDRANGVTATTPRGSARAPRMIVAANGFSENFGFLANKFVHLALHASLTRPLSEAEQRAYGVSATWGLTPANGFGGITMRYTADRRILIRQQIDVSMAQRVSPARLAALARRHKALFDNRFPMLSDVTMAHTWTGYICMSRNGAPAFGAVAPNVWAAACHNGIGVAKGTIAGVLAADMASSQDNDLIGDMASLGFACDLPPRPLVGLGARAKIALEIWKNRREA